MSDLMDILAKIEPMPVQFLIDKEQEVQELAIQKELAYETEVVNITKDITQEIEVVEYTNETIEED